MTLIFILYRLVEYYGESGFNTQHRLHVPGVDRIPSECIFIVSSCLYVWCNRMFCLWDDVD